MQLTVTVLDPSSGAPPRDLVIDAPRGATLGDVRGQLLAAVGTSAAEPVCCEGAPLTDGAVLGRPPLLSGAVLMTGVPALPAAAGVLELHVTAGPDAGGVHRLPPGEHVLGRGLEADVRVHDPQLSRAHLLIRVGQDESTVSDLGSVNGTVVGSQRVTSAGAAFRPGDVIVAGDSRLELVVPRPGPPARVGDDGHLLVARPPRLGGLLLRDTVEVPTPPVPREPARLPLMAVAVPTLVGAGLLLVTRNPTYLLFVLLSPVTALGAWLGDRFERRRATRRDQGRYAQDCGRLRRDLAGLAARQSADRHERFPSLSRLAQQARAPDRRVWVRSPGDPDLLVVRLGLASLPASVAFIAADGGGPASTPPGIAAPTLDDVPATVSLAEHAPLGVAGPLSVTAPLLRSWAMQLACLHGPSTLRLHVLGAGPEEEWSWLRWVPHAGAGRTGLDAWVAELDRRRASGSTPRSTEAGRCEPLRPHWVLLVDGPDVLRGCDSAARVLGEGASVGMYVVVAARREVELPGSCQAVVVVNDATPARLTLRRRGGTELTGIRPDGVSRGCAESVARALAPLRESATDAGSQETLRDDVRLVGLLGASATDAESLARAWSAAPPLSAVPVGRGAGGAPIVVDLASDGPHLLVAGTTGSGKSELLQSLIAALAVAHRPDQLAFVLVDFKGGAAFRECAQLPHTVGLVTDLDAHDAGRLLRSLRGLVSRRERALADVSVADIRDYGGTADRPVIPRIVVVIDEFATLHDELPDLVNELVSVARRGRSLGLHLVLATQRPGGVVSSDIRANTGLRLCLRVSDAADSTDVIDVADAARIGSDQPGRGYVRRAGGALEQVQVARVTGVTTDRDGGVQVRPVDGDGRVRATVEAGTLPRRDDRAERPNVPGSDLTRLVATTRAAAEALAIGAAPSPWLPPLPRHLPRELLVPAPARTSLVGGEELVPAAIRRAVAIGLTDLPENGEQPAWCVDPVGGGNLLVVGAAGSGRSQTLVTVAAQLVETHSPARLHIYALDGSSRALRPLGGVAHCAAVAAPDDPAFAARVLRRLVEELERRETGAGAPDEPAVLLLVDDWTRWRSALEDVDGAAAIDDLHRLARSGAAAGIGVVLSAEREVLGSRLADAFRERVVLRLADRTDFALAGIDRAAVPRQLPPGRGVLATSGVEVQVAAPTTDLGAGLRVGPPGAAGPLRLRPLPGRVSRRDLPTGGCANGWLALGLGGDEAAPVILDVSDGSGTPALVVIGPPRSGRSSVLCLAAAAYADAGLPVAVAAPPRSPLSALPGVTRLDPHDIAGLRAHLGECSSSRRLVLVDDVEAFHDTALDDELAAMLRPGSAIRSATGTATQACTVVLAGTADDLGARFRGFTVEARRQRCGLLLGPTGPGEGDLLGIRLPRQPAGPRGRGLLVVHGEVTPVQLACPEEPGHGRPPAPRASPSHQPPAPRASPSHQPPAPPASPGHQPPAPLVSPCQDQPPVPPVPPVPAVRWAATDTGSHSRQVASRDS